MAHSSSTCHSSNSHQIDNTSCPLDSNFLGQKSKNFGRDNNLKTLCSNSYRNCSTSLYSLQSGDLLVLYSRIQRKTKKKTILKWLGRWNWLNSNRSLLMDNTERSYSFRVLVGEAVEGCSSRSMKNRADMWSYNTAESHTWWDKQMLQNSNKIYSRCNTERNRRT